MSKSASSSAGPGLVTLLTVLFVGLKLTGHIDWAWVWVLSPLWVGLGLFLAFLLLAVVIALMVKPKVPKPPFVY